MTIRYGFHKTPSPRGLSVTVDERAFAEAEERFRDTYRIAYQEGSRWGDCEQAHHEAIQEALEAFLGCYLEETVKPDGTI